MIKEDILKQIRDSLKHFISQESVDEILFKLNT